MFQWNSFLNHLPALLLFNLGLETVFLKDSRQFSWISWQIEKTYHSEFYTPKMHHHFLLGLKAVTVRINKVPVTGIVTLPRIPFKHSLAYSKTIKPFTLTLTAKPTALPL